MDLVGRDVLALVGVVGFLTAISVLARASADEGLFRAWGGWVARRRPRRRLVAGGVIASAVSVGLTLDATAVLVTPVLLAAGLARRGALLTLRLANTASTLLPVSNLTNLLVFSASGVGFWRFAVLMAPGWVLGVIAEVLIVRRWCRADPAPSPEPALDRPAVPLLPAVVVVIVLAAVAVGIEPWVAATVGAVVVGVRSLGRQVSRPTELLSAANLPLALGVVVWGAVVLLVGTTPIGSAVRSLVPDGDAWWCVVIVALVGMIAAALVNNLPAALLLVPAAAAAGPVPVLALLIGLNVGANLSPTSSLANLLWYRAGGRLTTTWSDVVRLGLLTTPALVVVSASVLWAWSTLLG